MRRLLPSLAAVALAACPSPALAGAFDYYTNPVLAKVPATAGVKEVKRLTPGLIADNDRLLPQTTAAFVVVKTNDGRYSKLLVQAGRQVVARNSSGTVSVPVLLIERYVTYREGEERAVQAKGESVRLFDGFHFSLDLGQVVPARLGGDLRFVARKGQTYAEPVGKARLYLLTKPLPEAVPPDTGHFVMGAKFEPRYFAGTYRLDDDGRRTGTLRLKVEDKNRVTGAFYSDGDGRRYEVSGKLGPAPNAIRFTIAFPRTRQEFRGWMLTGTAKAMTGYATSQNRETGFYALRKETGK